MRISINGCILTLWLLCTGGVWGCAEVGGPPADVTA